MNWKSAPPIASKTIVIIAPTDIALANKAIAAMGAKAIATAMDIARVVAANLIRATSPASN